MKKFWLFLAIIQQYIWVSLFSIIYLQVSSYFIFKYIFAYLFLANLLLVLNVF